MNEAHGASGIAPGHRLEAIVAVAEVALRLVFRRRIFWAFYALAAFHFFSYFFGVYLTVQIKEAVRQQQEQVRLLPFAKAVNPERMWQLFADRLGLGGEPNMYRNYIWTQGWIAVVMLALAGALLIGQDYATGGVVFYLSKAITATDYLLGKFLAVAVVILLTVAVPAWALYVQYGLLEGWDYFAEQSRVPAGILGYSLAMIVVLGSLVLATAVWLRKTVPMVLVWLGVMLFSRSLSRLLVDVVGLSPRWRLLDLWNDLYLVGSRFLSVPATLMGRLRGQPAPQPSWQEAAAVLVVVCVLCWWYLHKRLRAVEIVT
ncbi:MAG: ABC transporter permease subunit [Gemmatales bacterium]|nr:ABC transporter permease subunit [Gemmatales bacterium]MDW8222920.1 ABC transporter permease subunit [Gemmatales bacterium]